MSSNDLNPTTISEAQFAQLVPIPTPDPITAHSERDRFHQFVVSDVARHRLLYSRQLGVMAATDLDLVLQALVPLASDPDHQIRLSACTDLADIYRAGILQNLHEVVLKTLIEVLKIALLDEANDLRSTAMDSILAMAPLMARSKIANIILPITDQMWNQTSSDEIRASSVILQYRLIPWLDTDQQSRIRQHTPSWSKDSSFRVRKSVARYMFEAGEDYLPVAESLSRDPIWSVRQAIVQGLIQSLQRIESSALRQEFLIPQMKRSCADMSRWVRKESHEVLGTFIFHLDLDQIDDELLSLFTSLSALSQDAADCDANYAFAYHFPAVVARLGRRRWSGLSKSYLLLCSNPTFKVRRTLAYSLCEIGRILGPEITDSDLLHIFEIFFKDLDEVREGVIENISKIFSCMSMKHRLNYTDLLWEIQKEASRQWRYKASLASQLNQLSELFPIDVICTRLLPLALTLMHDRVAFVRQVAVQSIGGLLQLVETAAPGAFDELIAECLYLSTAESCHDRQLFLYLCQSLLYTIHIPLFRNYFLGPFVALAHDRVINVRRLLARIIFELPLDHAFRSDPEVVLAMRYLHSAEQVLPIACPLSPSIQLPLAIAGLEPIKSASEKVDVDIRSDDIKGSGEFVQDSGSLIVSV